MKKFIGSLLVFVSSLAAAAGGQSYFFVQFAPDGRLIKHANQTYTLELHKVSNNISYFTNRPVRKRGVIPLQTFINLWKNKKINNNFLSNPPNVALTMKTASGKYQHFISEINDASYSDHTLRYTLKLIGTPSIETGKVEEINLFFDSIHWNPGGF